MYLNSCFLFFLILTTDLLHTKTISGLKTEIKHKRSLSSWAKLGRDAVQGLRARAALLSGTKRLKVNRPSGVRERTYTKHGNWIDVIHDFNSVSPTTVVTIFVKGQVRTGKVGDRIIEIEEKGWHQKPSMKIYKYRDGKLQTDEIIYNNKPRKYSLTA